MNRLRNLLAALTVALVIISCGDGDDVAPVVNITSPSANSTFAVTDTILLTGTVTEDTKLETVVVSSDLGLDVNLTPLDSDTSHVVNANITLDAMTTAGAYTITVTATDEEGNAGSDSVEINVQ